MKKLIFIFVLLLATPAFATNYYVTKTGDNTKSGTSWVNAWKTISKVNATLSAGDSVYFGTGTWYDSRITPPTGGSYGVRTLYSCSTLTTATKFLTKIHGGDSLTGWTQYNTNIWYATYSGGKSYCLVQDDDLMLHGESSLGAVGEGDFYHNTGASRVYAWLHGGGNPNDREMLINNNATISLGVGRGYCTFYGLDIRLGQPGAVAFWGSNTPDSVFFEYCHLKFGSNARGENPAVISFGHPNTDSTHYAYYDNFYVCSVGTAINYGSYLSSHMGIGYSGYATMHCYIDSCYFYDLEYGVQHKAHSWLNDPNKSNVVRNSTFKDMTHTGIYYSNTNRNDSIYGNIIIDAGVNGIGSEDWHDDVIPYDVFIYNNTIYNAGTNAMWNMTDRNTNQNFKYNVVYSTGATNYDFNLHYSINEDWTIDSNIYYNTTRNFVAYTPSSGTATLSQWQARGYDIRSDTSDPGLNDPANGSFSRPSASGEMNLTYGGKTWTIYGAVQPPAEPPGCQVELTSGHLPYTVTSANIGDTICISGSKISTSGGGIIIGSGAHDVYFNFGTDTLRYGTGAGTSIRGMLFQGGCYNITVNGGTIIGGSSSGNYHYGMRFEVCHDILIQNTDIVSVGANSFCLGSGSVSAPGAYNIEISGGDYWNNGSWYTNRCQYEGAAIRLRSNVYLGYGDYHYKVHGITIHTSPGQGIVVAGNNQTNRMGIALIYDNTITCDSRNYAYSYPQEDGCHSAANAYGIILSFCAAGSKVYNNTLRSGTTHGGSRGIMVENSLGTPTNWIEVYDNDVDVHEGPNAAYADGSSLAGPYALRIRSIDGHSIDYVHAYDNSFIVTADNNSGTSSYAMDAKALVITDHSTTDSIIVENNLFKATAVNAGCETYAGYMYAFGNGGTTTTFKYNRWESDEIVLQIGAGGLSGRNTTFYGDTLDSVSPTYGFKTFAIGQGTGLTCNNNFMHDVVFEGDATYDDITFSAGGTLNIGLKKEVVVVVMGNNDSLVANADVWCVNNYGDTVFTGNSGGAGWYGELATYHYEARGTPDSTAFNDFTFGAQKAGDSSTATVTITWDNGQPDTVTLSSTAGTIDAGIEPTPNPPGPVHSIVADSLEGSPGNDFSDESDSLKLTVITNTQSWPDSLIIGAARDGYPDSSGATDTTIRIAYPGANDTTIYYIVMDVYEPDTVYYVAWQFAKDSGSEWSTPESTYIFFAEATAPPNPYVTMVLDSVENDAAGEGETDTLLIIGLTPAEDTPDSIYIIVSNTGFCDSSTAYTIEKEYVGADTYDSNYVDNAWEEPYTVYVSCWLWDTVTGFSMRKEASITYSETGPTYLTIKGITIRRLKIK